MKQILRTLRSILPIRTSIKLSHSAVFSAVAIGVLAGAILALPQAGTPDLLSTLFAESEKPIESGTELPVTTVSVAVPAGGRAELSLPEFYEGLPVASVKTYTADENWGTVLLFPQYHQAPGSKPEDPQNDRGIRSQAEIKSVIERIEEKADIPLVMIEGETVGEVPQEKVGEIAKRIEARNAFAAGLERLRKLLSSYPINSAIEQSAAKDAESFLAKIDREIALLSAPTRLKAEGMEFVLVGAEDPETFSASRAVVQDYIYLQDRLASLGRSPLSVIYGQSQSVTPEIIARILKNRGGIIEKYVRYMELLGRQPFGLTRPLTASVNELVSFGTDFIESAVSTFGSLKAVAEQQGYDDVANAIESLEAAKEELTSKPNPKESSIAASRNQNPYASVYNRTVLEQKKRESEQKILDLILNRRNRETADHMVEALREYGEQFGVLQFGARHTEGLVRELNKRGLSVIVVATDTLAQSM